MFWTDTLNRAMLNNNIITVSDRTDVNNSYGTFGFSANIKNINRYYEEWKNVFNNSKKVLGALSPSLNICSVAQGKSDFFIDFGCSFEGQAAAGLILKEAGGKIFNYNKTDWDYKKTGIIATNGKLNLLNDSNESNKILF